MASPDTTITLWQAVSASAPTAEETAWRAGVAGRTHLVHLQKHGIAVAIHTGLDQPLMVSAGFTLSPGLLARARPVGDMPGCRVSRQGLPVHPGHHQHLARFLALGDGRHQAVLVEFDRRQEGGVGKYRSVIFASLASPFPGRRSGRPASSSPAWMRSTGPSASKGRRSGGYGPE